MFEVKKHLGIIMVILPIISCGLRSRKKISAPLQESTFVRQEESINDADAQGQSSVQNPGALHTDTIQAPNIQEGNSELKIPSVSKGNPFTCEEEKRTASPTPLIRLNQKEYQRTVSSLFGEYLSASQIMNILQSIPADNRKGFFHNQDLSIALPTIQGYFSAAHQIALILSRNQDFSDENFPCTTLNENCIKSFGSSLGKRIIRRPWSQKDTDKYFTFINSIDTTTKEEQLSALLSALLQTPEMIYKVEIGDSELSAGVYKLHDWELAHRIAYTATGSLPTTQTWELIESGELQDPKVLKDWIEDLFQQTSTREHIESFYSQWLSFHELPSPGYTSRFLGGLSATNLARDAQQELQALTNDMTWTSSGSYSDLLTTTKSFGSSDLLQAIYQNNSELNPTAQTLSVDTFQFNENGPEDIMGQRQWTPYGNQAQAQFSLNFQKNDSIQIQAYGQSLNGVSPVMTVQILDSNQSELSQQNIEVSSDSAKLFPLNVPPTEGEITVVLGTNNDEIQNGNDRNLWILNAQIINSLSTKKESSTTKARKGILSRVGFLLSGDDSTHLVHRGVKIRQRVLCEKMNPPAVDPDTPDLFDPPAPNAEKSTKDQIAERTSAPQCAACHTRINPMGFVLESYDAIGRHRDIERIFSPNGVLIAEHPVDTTVHPNIYGPNEAEVHNANEMSDAIAESTKGPACMSLQWFAYTRQREATENDICEMKEFYDQLQTDDSTSYSRQKPATLLNLLQSSFLTGAFQTLVKALEE
ncbi:MAG: DUF1588 domain-containing protein [Oligoflexales bacterium]